MKKKLLLLVIGLFCFMPITKAQTVQEAGEKFIKDGVFAIDSIKPENVNDVEFYSASYFMQNLSDEMSGYLGDCNDDLSECSMFISSGNQTFSKKVKVVWKETDLKIKEIVESYATKIKNGPKLEDRISFDITGLEYINYMQNVANSDLNSNIRAINEIAQFSSQLKNIIDNDKITYQLDARLGNGFTFNNLYGGALTLLYDGVVYSYISTKSVVIKQNSIIYIPDDTPNTSEDYVKEAQKVIDNYLGNHNIKIEVGGKLKEDFADYDFSVYGDISLLGDYYYKITIGENTKYFVIARNTSKMTTDAIYSSEFQKITKDGKVYIPAIKPKNDLEFDYFTNGYLLNNITPTLKEGTFAFIANIPSENFDKCTIRISKNSGEFIEAHEVTLVYASENENYKNNINKVYNELKDTKGIRLVDMNLLNFYLNNGYVKGMGTAEKAINYFDELKSYNKDNQLKFEFDFRMGDVDPMNSFGAGAILYLYDNVIYSYSELGAGIANLIYIPDETENTKEAFVEAAQKRINEYFGDKTTIKIEVGDLLTKYKNEYMNETEVYDFSSIGDVSKMSDYYYNIVIGEEKIPFVLLKDSSKIPAKVEEVKMTIEDKTVNLKLEITSASVPLDVKVSLEEIKKDSDEHKEIIKKLKSDKFYAIDITLNSSSAGNISKIEDGVFKVSIPISQDLLNKKLVAYYFSDDGKVEEHEITLKDGIATFTTTHFSTYIIAEKGTYEAALEKTPATIDNIKTFIACAGFTFVGLVAITIYKKKFN